MLTRWRKRSQSGGQTDLVGTSFELEKKSGYWIYAAMRREDGECRMGGGRYIDRLEKREGKWGIVVRKCLMDWSTGGGANPLTPQELAAMADMEKTTRDKNDPSYQRPLTVRPDRPAHGEGILEARRASRRAWPLAKEFLPFYD